MVMEFVEREEESLERESQKVEGEWGKCGVKGRENLLTADGDTHHVPSVVRYV